MTTSPNVPEEEPSSVTETEVASQSSGTEPAWPEDDQGTTLHPTVSSSSAPQPDEWATDEQWAAMQQAAQPSTEAQWGSQPSAPSREWTADGQWASQPSAEQAWVQQPADQQWASQPSAPQQDWAAQQQWGATGQWGQQADPSQAWGSQPSAPQQAWASQPSAPQQTWASQPAAPQAGVVGFDQQAQYPVQQPSAPVAPGVAGQQYAAPAVPGWFMQALTAQWASFVTLIKGDTNGALAIGHRTPRFWLVGFLLGAMAYGLTLTFVFSRMLAMVANAAQGLFGSFFNGLIDGLDLGSVVNHYEYEKQYVAFSFGDGIVMFLCITVGAFLIFLLRTGLHKAVLGLRHVPASFAQVATVQAVGYSGHTLVLLAAFVVALLPSSFLVTIALLMLTLLVPISFGAELASYIGINQFGRPVKSHVVPYTVLYAIFQLLSFVLGYMAFATMIDMVG